MTAQDEAFAWLVTQLGLLRAADLRGLADAVPAGQAGAPLAQRIAERGLLPPSAVSKALREVVRAAYRCDPCARAYGYDSLAALASLRCPRCDAPLRPERRRPSADGTAPAGTGDVAASARPRGPADSASEPVPSVGDRADPFQFAEGSSLDRPPGPPRTGSDRVPRGVDTGPPSTGALQAVGGAAERALGEYVLIEELGRGANGVVYLARRKGLARQFAVKVLLDAEFADEEDLRRFRLEAAVASKLDDPGIARVYEVGRQGNHYYYAMEYCEGETLEQRLRRDGALSPREAAKLIAKLARTLHQAHRAGIVHRDLKPANIILGSDRPRITDFGLARDRALQRSLTRTGTLLGTPSYMAPEAFRGGGAKDLDHRADVFSLGVVLYECLTGERPFVAETALLLAQRICQADPPPPSQRRRQVPRALDAVVSRALAKDLQQRYASMEEFALDLERWLQGKAPHALPPEHRRGRANRWHFALVAAVALFCAALPLTVWALWRAHARAERRAEAEAVLARPDADAAAVRACLELAAGDPELTARVEDRLADLEHDRELKALSAELESPTPNLEDLARRLTALEAEVRDDPKRKRRLARLAHRLEIARLTARARAEARAPGYSAQAERAYATAIERALDPDRKASLRWERLRYLYLRGRYEDVIRIAPDLARHDERLGLKAEFLAALALEELDREDEFLARCEELAARDPVGAVGASARACLALANNDFFGGRRAADDAVRLAPSWIPGRRLQALLALFEGDRKRLPSLLEELAARAPEWPRVLRLRCLVALRASEDPQGALEIAERARKLTEPTPAPWCLRALARLRLLAKDGAGALAAAERLRERQPEDARARVLWALARLGQGDHNAAGSELAALYREDPGGLRNLLAEYLHRGARSRLLEEAKRRAASLPGKASPTREGIRVGELPPQLEAALRPRWERAPAAARSALRDALLAAARGDPLPTVRRALDAARVAAPDSPPVAYERARLLLGRDDYDAAEEALAAARSLAAAPAPRLDRMSAELLLRRGFRARAARAFGAVARADPEGAEGRCAQAEALLARGQRARAAVAARRLLETAPDHVGAWTVLALASSERTWVRRAVARAYERVGASDARLVLADVIRCASDLMGSPHNWSPRRGGALLQRVNALFGLTESALPRVGYCEAVLGRMRPPPAWKLAEAWLTARIGEAAQMEPERPMVHVLQGVLALRSGSSAEEVLGHWRRAVALDPEVDLSLWATTFERRHPNEPDLRSLLGR
ncbi:MAG: serine/threonine-protein kinase [Planctomycetota bacterium]|nr:MAG: serine/threonine-protein kinase [Planctomycetota bacterium]